MPHLLLDALFIAGVALVLVSGKPVSRHQHTRVRRAAAEASFHPSHSTRGKRAFQVLDIPVSHVPVSVGSIEVSPSVNVNGVDVSPSVNGEGIRGSSQGNAGGPDGSSPVTLGGTDGSSPASNDPSKLADGVPTTNLLEVDLQSDVSISDSHLEGDAAQAKPQEQCPGISVARHVTSALLEVLQLHIPSSPGEPTPPPGTDKNAEVDSQNAPASQPRISQDHLTSLLETISNQLDLVTKNTNFAEGKEDMVKHNLSRKS